MLDHCGCALSGRLEFGNSQYPKQLRFRGLEVAAALSVVKGLGLHCLQRARMRMDGFGPSPKSEAPSRQPGPLQEA